MTRSVYVVGGAGTGKSTFTAQLMARAGATSPGPLIDLHKKPNSRGTVITLRGHEIPLGVGKYGLYLGVLREEFPGTDGLDRVSSVPGVDWLENGGASAYRYIVGEGATLAVRSFLYALHGNTDLLVVWLTADEVVKDLRFLERGSNQDPKFVQATETRARNLAVELDKNGVSVWEVESENPTQWAGALHDATEHLCGSR